MNTSTRDNTLIMQRSVFKMSNALIAAFHGWTEEQLNYELAATVRRLYESGKNYETIKRELRIDNEFIDKSINNNLETVYKDNNTILTKLDAITATVSILTERLMDCENEIYKLKKENEKYKDLFKQQPPKYNKHNFERDNIKSRRYY